MVVGEEKLEARRPVVSAPEDSKHTLTAAHVAVPRVLVYGSLGRAGTNQEIYTLHTEAPTITGHVHTHMGHMVVEDEKGYSPPFLVPMVYVPVTFLPHISAQCQVRSLTRLCDRQCTNRRAVKSFLKINILISGINLLECCIAVGRENSKAS